MQLLLRPKNNYRRGFVCLLVTLLLFSLFVLCVFVSLLFSLFGVLTPHPQPHPTPPRPASPEYLIIIDTLYKRGRYILINKFNTIVSAVKLLKPGEKSLKGSQLLGVSTALPPLQGVAVAGH